MLQRWSRREGGRDAEGLGIEDDLEDFVVCASEFKNHGLHLVNVKSLHTFGNTKSICGKATWDVI